MDLKVDSAVPSSQEKSLGEAADYEAIGWAVRKLTAFGVANNTMDNALMMDRLEAMLRREGF